MTFQNLWEMDVLPVQAIQVALSHILQMEDLQIDHTII